MSRRKLSRLIVTILLLLLVSYFGKDSLLTTQKEIQTISPTPITIDSQKETVLSASDSSLLNRIKVIKVIDGDTVEIEGGEKIRYIGIDTPETKHPTKGVECFGKEAFAKNKELVEGKEIRLEKDVSETDRYGRLLRFVYIGDIFVNDYLLRQGYAHASTYPPDVKMAEQFRAAEKEARENNRGLWSSCSK